MSCDSNYAKQMCETSAKVCEACVKECERNDMDHCKQCSQCNSEISI
jgi:hypothetical protein